MTDSTRILHCADVHLSASEEGYSLRVLKEIRDLALQNEVQFLLISGDLFDTFGDAEQLRSQVRALFQKAPFRILYIPGNHEELERTGQKELSLLDFGPVAPLSLMPCTLVEGDERVEFLAIPHQLSFREYRSWQIPEKRAHHRVALAHGVVPEMLRYTGPDNEEGAGTLELDLFLHHQVDFAALGHIHSAREFRYNRLLLSYPGSSRVWRKGEEGKRKVSLLTVTSREIRTEPLPLVTAGEYRSYEIPLHFDGESSLVGELSGEWHQEDWVDLQLSGLVENESDAAAFEEKLRRQYASSLRKLTVDRSRVDVVPGIASRPLARQFLERWEARDPGEKSEERRIWLRAREMALNEIRDILEKQS